jgi:hypothetical protein
MEQLGTDYMFLHILLRVGNTGSEAFKRAV